MMENIHDLLRAHEGLTREVFLDSENSCAVPKEVVDEMLPYFNQRAYGNPTLTHKPGWEAFEAIMKSSQKIAGFLGCRTLEEVNFAPGETEANNLALAGTAYAMRSHGKKIIICDTEPINILHVVDMLQKRGFTVVKVPVDSEGLVNLGKLEEAIDSETIIVSISAVNHEIGTIEPIREALEIVKDRNTETIFHTDASDAYGRIPFNVKDLDVDLATISSCKILGPRGTGALYVKKSVPVERLLEGQIGTQNLWPGIENVPSIVGFAKASELIFHNFEGKVHHLRKLRDKLIDGITRKLPGVILNGPRDDKRAPDNVNISFRRCEGEALTIELSLNGVYVSSGSACTRRLLQPSHVLVAIGRSYVEAHGSILMKVTWNHKESDIDYVLDVIPKAVKRIREIAGSVEVK